MKKLLLGLGSIASVVAPVAAVISCGDDSTTTPGTNGTQGTEGHTVTISDNTVVQAVGSGLNAALGLAATNVDSVVAGDNLNLSLGTSGTSSLNFAHYTKITFKTNDTITTGLIGTGATVAVNAGDSLVIGIPAAQRRTAAPAAADLKVVLMGKNGTNMKIAVDAAKLSQLKSGVLDKVVEHVEASKPGSGDGAGNGATTGINVAAVTEVSSTKAMVQLVLVGGSAPTHLSKTEIEPAMTQLKALPNNATFTEITFSITDTAAVTTTYVVPITAGKANDVDAIAAAAASVTGTTGTVTTPGGGTGSTTGQASITVDLGVSTGGVKTKTSVIAAIKAATGFVAGTTTTVALTLDSASVGSLTLAAGDDADIEDKLTKLITNTHASAACFDMTQ